MDDGDGSNERALSPGGDESDSEDTWHLPDDLSWHHEQGYSESVAVALGCAHRRLRGKGDVVAYRRALACVQPVMDGGMSERQRLHVLFIVALAHASTYPQDAALDPIDAAIELAINLDERRALEDLLYLRGSINRALLAAPDAVDDLEDCLDLLDVHSLARAPTPAQVKFRLDATLHLAGTKFLLGDHEMAARLLDQAENLVTRAPDSVTQKAILSWTRALLLRWRGELEVALTTAMIAAETLRVHGHPGNASRAQTLVADIALDLTERLNHVECPDAAREFLTLGEAYVQRALDLAQQGDVASSEAMARVTQARWERLSHGVSHEGLLHELSAIGHSHRDVALEALAFAELGADFEARGDLESAIHWYKRALAILNESKMTALGVWARRALWRLSGEMSSAQDTAGSGPRSAR